MYKWLYKIFRIWVQLPTNAPSPISVYITSRCPANDLLLHTSTCVNSKSTLSRSLVQVFEIFSRTCFQLILVIFSIVTSYEDEWDLKEQAKWEKMEFGSKHLRTWKKFEEALHSPNVGSKPPPPKTPLNRSPSTLRPVGSDSSRAAAAGCKVAAQHPHKKQ